MCAIFKEPPTNILLTERLWNVKLNKLFVCFANIFPKEAKAIYTKTFVWILGKLIGYQMIVQNN